MVVCLCTPVKLQLTSLTVQAHIIYEVIRSGLMESFTSWCNNNPLKLTLSSAQVVVDHSTSDMDAAAKKRHMISRGCFPRHVPSDSTDQLYNEHSLKVGDQDQCHRFSDGEIWSQSFPNVL